MNPNLKTLEDVSPARCVARLLGLLSVPSPNAATIADLRAQADAIGAIVAKQGNDHPSAIAALASLSEGMLQICEVWREQHAMAYPPAPTSVDGRRWLVGEQLLVRVVGVTHGSRVSLVAVEGNEQRGWRLGIWIATDIAGVPVPAIAVGQHRVIEFKQRGGFGSWQFRPGVRPPGAGRCRTCGCTQLDCSGCVALTGAPCTWFEPDLCTACVGRDIFGLSRERGS